MIGMSLKESFELVAQQNGGHSLNQAFQLELMEIERIKVGFNTMEFFDKKTRRLHSQKTASFSHFFPKRQGK